MEYKENSKCRTCLLECNNLLLLTSHYLACNELMCLADIITGCTSVKMTLDDKMPRYVCETCASKAKNAYDFKKQCENSDAILKSQLPLIKNDDSRVEFVTCQTCSRSFNSTEDLSEHLLEHEDSESLYQCSECPVKFTTQENLDKHLVREHDTKRTKVNFTCNFCCETFHSESLYNEHNCMKTTNTLRAMRRSRREAIKKIHENRDLSSERSDDNSEPEKCSLIKPEFKPVTTNQVIHNAKDVKQEDFDETITWQKILKYSTQKNENDLYECICCTEKYEKLSDLRQHTRSHKIFNCKLCKKKFTIISNLRRHLRSHTDDSNVKQEDEEDSSMKENVSNEFKCVACTKTFPRRKLLSEHLKTHSVFPCLLCNVTFTFATNLRKHLRWHKRPKEDTRVWNQPPAEKRTCDVCFKVFKYRPSMLKHRRKHDNVGKPCPYCEQVFPNSIKLYKHMEAYHEHEKNIVCQECGKKFFKEWNLKMHMNVHTGVRPYMCEICGASFALCGNLNSHKRLHTGHKPYKCDTCGRGFTQQAALRSHEAGHSNRRDHVCPECGAAFTRAGAMRNHRKRHATREFPCNMCGKRFTFSSERKRHMLIHTGEKNYVCDFCGKAFNRATNLRVHRRIHTGEHPHKCNICGKGFIQAHCLKTHMYSHCREEPAAESRPAQEVQQNNIPTQIVIAQPFL